MGMFDFLKKNKNIKTENGLNLIHFNNGKGALMKRFYKKNGEKDGVYHSYYENGQLEEESNWKDGYSAGWKKYYENGQLRSENIKEEESTTTNYYQSGEIRKVNRFDKDGNNFFEEKEYYENGKLKFEHKDMYRREDGIIKKGFAKSYYESGELKCVSNFIGGEEIGLSKCYYKNGELEKEVSFLETFGGKSNLRFNEKSSNPYKDLLDQKILNQLGKNGDQEYKHQINQFINEMKKIPDWYEIIQARGNGQAMMVESMNIKLDDYEFWANTHKEEYILKYNDGNLDVEGIKLRIEKFGFIVSELEKLIKKAAELNYNITHEMHNDYCAARASLLGAEYALKEMTKVIKKNKHIENDNGLNDVL